MICCASWSVIVPLQTTVFRAVWVLSLTLAPTSDGGKGPRDVNGVPGVPHISGHRFFASRGIAAQLQRNEVILLVMSRVLVGEANRLELLLPLRVCVRPDGRCPARHADRL